jgi:hypothetical protein
MRKINDFPALSTFSRLLDVPPVPAICGLFRSPSDPPGDPAQIASGWGQEFARQISGTPENRRAARNKVPPFISKRSGQVGIIGPRQ